MFAKERKVDVKFVEKWLLQRLECSKSISAQQFFLMIFVAIFYPEILCKNRIQKTVEIVCGENG